ncbi:hypothetical protein A4G23_00534 [Streptomyces rubrolavendulae]|uniref:Uncharacterized protein n=1 Tax=Streptomyces rubrolavendulae TaxID=285473 RepID=A0A1D8FX00_9ACTN|nr:hypothetical protein A4G23_00534 [Streptomyces rubrolavendulae]
MRGPAGFLGAMTSAPTRRITPRRLAPLGAALAGTLLPLALGVLLAKAMAADPMTPVNALVTNGGRARISPADLRGCGYGGLRRRARDAVRRPGRRVRTAAKDPAPEGAAAGT